MIAEQFVDPNQNISQSPTQSTNADNPQIFDDGGFCGPTNFQINVSEPAPPSGQGGKHNGD